MLHHLREILDTYNLTLTEAAHKTGIPQPRFSMMLRGTRPISDQTWLTILTKIEGLTKTEARSQLAQWRITEEKKYLKKPHTITITGNHNEITLPNPTDRQLINDILTANQTDKEIIRDLLKTLKKKHPK